jgi:RNA polymerase sigma-70 factor (ECF subfamily)
MDSLVPENDLIRSGIDTERAKAGHPREMTSASPTLEDFTPVEGPASRTRPAQLREVLSFDAVYEECFDFVWRSLRSLGVHDASLDDAVQDVFVVVHRRLGDFEARSTIRTWVFGIAVRVSRDYRRRERRKGGLEPLDFETAAGLPGPDEEAATAEALRQVALILDALDDVKREVFVLAEIEELTAPEIAEALGVNVNTVYARIRAARSEFKAAYEARHGRTP